MVSFAYHFMVSDKLLLMNIKSQLPNHILASNMNMVMWVQFFMSWFYFSRWNQMEYRLMHGPQIGDKSGHQPMSYGQSCWQFNSTIAHCQKPLSWNMDLFQCPQNALRYLQCMYLYKSRLNFSIKTLNSLGSDWEIWEKWTQKKVSNFENNQFFENIIYIYKKAI